MSSDTEDKKLDGTQFLVVYINYRDRFLLCTTCGAIVSPDWQSAHEERCK